jgi:hypothetical protein
METTRTVAIQARLPADCSQCIHDVIEAHRGAARTGTKLRCGFDGTGVGGPRREDGALLVQSQVGIVDDLRGMTEGLCGMEKLVKIETIA